MKRIGEYAEHIFPGLKQFAGSIFQRTARPEATQTALSRYTYSQIARICDQALAPSRVREILDRNQQLNTIYQDLSKDTPAPITAAVVIGLARAGNLEVTDVDILREMTSVLPVFGRQYRPFCAAIERSIQETNVMPRSSRPDYASSQQLAAVARDSFGAFRTLKWRGTRFVPYVTLEGQVISSRNELVDSLREGDDMAGACVRMAVDLGVLTTQPQRITLKEREWLSGNIHYVKMSGNSRLNTALEVFNNLVRNQ